MIGVVVPAHNEEADLHNCLEALLRAARHPALHGEPVRITVVLDGCTDGSAEIARAHPVRAIGIQACNVGVARYRGAADLLAAGARWLAFTDADSVVSESWLSDQLSLQGDAVCGCVTVADWTGHSEKVRNRYLAHYQHRDDHRHVHGANLGVSAQAYAKAGGFLALPLGEDVALVDALLGSGATIRWSALPRVFTSARKITRAVGGFGHFIASLGDDDGLAA